MSETEPIQRNKRLRPCLVCGLPHIPGDMVMHISGKKHQKKLKKQMPSVPANDANAKQTNRRRRPNNNNAIESKEAPESYAAAVERPEENGNRLRPCLVCGLGHIPGAMAKHINGKKHQKKLKKQTPSVPANDANAKRTNRRKRHNNNNAIEPKEAPESYAAAAAAAVERPEENDKDNGNRLGEQPTPPKKKHRPYNCGVCKMRGIRMPKSKHNETPEHTEEFAKYVKDAEEALEDLPRMNGWLVKLNEEKEPTKSAARAKLKRLHINIYDLLNDNFRRHATVRSLATYTANRNLWFPLEAAKTQGLREFLRPLKNPSRWRE